MVDTDVDERDLERFLGPFMRSSSSILRLRLLSTSFLASSSSAIPSLFSVSLVPSPLPSLGYVLAKQVIRYIAGKCWDKLRVRELLCPGWS